MDKGSASDEEWDQVEEIWEDESTFQCLFCKDMFSSLPELWEHAKKVHNFDFEQLKKQHQLDLYGCFKLVNYIRSMVKLGETPDFSDASVFANEKYMIPVLENDAVLFSLDEEESDAEQEQQSSHEASSRNLLRENASLKEQLNAMSKQLKALQTQKLEELTNEVKTTSIATASGRDNDSYYFEGYASNDIHYLMLSDAVRTDGYRDFIYGNKDIFKDKIVLDVGCGTGILSMFAAKAGAKHVYAVDNSNIIHLAIANAAENDLSKDITFIHGKVEEIKLPVEHVDIIISEWMGYALTFESMIDSVLIARDRYLAPGGLLAPSETRLVLTATTNTEVLEEYVDFWSNVYGFKMNGMKDAAYGEVHVQVVPESYVNAKPFEFQTLNMHSCAVENVSFTAPFTLQIENAGPLCAFTLWFDTYFSRKASDAIPSKILEGYGFTTGPHGKPTHWKQCVLLLRDRPFMEAGSQVTGNIEFSKNKDNNRDLDVTVCWDLQDKHYKQTFTLK
ncbi:type I ribosomal protein arginine N- methyltransferase Rmt3 [Schizosaccharomyces japonicus yFS275]|uniref:type I protein arginine methyltransferase n=1 Tax=Schizosaccharomyces japonicus (strain yFS275 / FY16936) TaxID=402676 RepID=B6K4I7_SCHJY|nr:type I ribosomal protein arginine N- methyltransferase Rmt3 [Schizosaccharomyces japonicus yFS275]EEB08394.1 type I ribosomal protein arginine N- methyltransferase Rmt3 [Schizosaccharomyces japonicus yFS275]